jgi:hypothetical protein
VGTYQRERAARGGVFALSSRHTVAAGRVIPNLERPRLVQRFITRSSYRRKINAVDVSYFSRRDELGVIDRALVESQARDLIFRGSESLWCQFCDDVYDSTSWYCTSCGRSPSSNGSNTHPSTEGLPQQVRECCMSRARQGLLVDNRVFLSDVDRRSQFPAGRREHRSDAPRASA